MLTRRCVACGHDVMPLDVLNGGCPDCACDFEIRPPRTYAEMEGFEAVATWIPMPFAEMDEPAQSVDRGRLRRRWLIFLAGVAGTIVSLGWIIGAATP